MELQKLDQYKTRFKEFGKKIGSLQSYLGEVAGKNNKDPDAISPYVLSRAINVSEIDALFLLTLAASENVVKRRYYVFSDHDDPLGEFSDTSEIPEVIEDRAHNAIDRDHYYVDLVFELNK